VEKEISLSFKEGNSLIFRRGRGGNSGGKKGKIYRKKKKKIQREKDKSTGFSGDGNHMGKRRKVIDTAQTGKKKRPPGEVQPLSYG